ncbi:hypothetical protein Tsubulata_005752 [Turnera subulata]|uniref:glycerophosphodiester phosphodiesterase n=1 Tax=Turnera subulata TaxID=218843 RepID=A0A9Q0GBX1_9ROSI|nr:hypothetical protein Tsubulata_005752 [Turnera subulata]
MIKYLLFISLLIHATSAVGPPDEPASPTSSKKWLTLKGERPVVVARGGFSGLFPESSDYANQMAISTALAEVVTLCNLQLTKDGRGICLKGVTLENSTTIEWVYPKRATTNKVNGQDVTGYFTIDYTSEELFSDVALVQSSLNRPSEFDDQMPISTVEDVRNSKPYAFWLNVQYDSFYTEHKLSVADYIKSTARLGDPNYISSPEIQFLVAMGKIVNKAKTKLIFMFLEKTAVEPTTKQTYEKLANDLAKIKEFAAGIVVPKDYIFPVDKNRYLEAPTTLVADAHKLGLEVYASGFANDNHISFNYSYDPAAEYLQFIDNGKFSVDGFITDFPPTASNAISCFAEYSGGKPRKESALVISHNGASGIYPGSTDLAYQLAVDDGADIIDCSVQMSKDGVAFCMDSVDVTKDTTAISTFISMSTTVPEIQPAAGIFSFDLSWSEIQTLQPLFFDPFGRDSQIPRNPANKNKGKFVTLAEFLEFAKAKAVTGVLINIELYIFTLNGQVKTCKYLQNSGPQNAGYLASKKGLDIVDAVSSALAKATLDKQSTQLVLIQSDDTSVLSKFQNVPAYKRVLYLKEVIGDAPRKPVDEIKKYADAVSLEKKSLITALNGYTMGTTKVVEEMHAANISVYASLLRNEFVSLLFDYFSDPTSEVATLTSGLQVDGVITDFPATASRYLRNPCSDVTRLTAIMPIEAGALISSMPPELQPPASAPSPALDVADIVDPPLPAVIKPPPAAPPTAPSGKSGAMTNAANMGLSLLALVGFCFFFQGY